MHDPVEAERLISMKRVFAWTLAGHLLFWAFWPLAVLAVATGVLVSLRASRREGALLILLSPFLVVPIFCFAGGIVGYARGEARLRAAGLPGPEFHNLDRDLRCYRSTSGCLVDGSEAFTHGPNNAAVRLMIRLFGPMLGAYLGPYPTREEAWALADAAPARVPASRLDPALQELARDRKGDWAVVDLQGQATVLADAEQALIVEKSRRHVIARYLR
jgi:hypothetical protein